MKTYTDDRVAYFSAILKSCFGLITLLPIRILKWFSWRLVSFHFHLSAMKIQLKREKYIYYSHSGQVVIWVTDANKWKPINEILYHYKHSHWAMEDIRDIGRWKMQRKEKRKDVCEYWEDIDSRWINGRSRRCSETCETKTFSHKETLERCVLCVYISMPVLFIMFLYVLVIFLCLSITFHHLICCTAGQGAM